jgi:hypothetical protein
VNNLKIEILSKVITKYYSHGCQNACYQHGFSIRKLPATGLPGDRFFKKQS